MGLVHVGLDLENEGGEVRRKHVDLAGIRNAGQRRRGHAQELFQERLHAEGGQSGAEKHRRQRSGADGLQIKFTPGAQQLHLVAQCGGLLSAQHFIQRGIVQGNFHGADLFALCFAGEEENTAFFPVIDALEFLAAADGPVHGVGVDPQLPLDFLAKLQRVPGLPVHFIDEGEDGDVPQGADLEQLSGLRLHALGAVDDHDGAVGGHQRPVGVL